MTDRPKPSDSDDVTSVRLAVGERVRSVDPRTHAAWRTWLVLAAANGERDAETFADAYDFKIGDVLIEAKETFARKVPSRKRAAFAAGVHAYEKEHGKQTKANTR